MPKTILEGLCLWPGKDSWFIKILNWLIFFNLCFMGWGHVAYVISNISDLPKAASAGTTVSTTFQTVCKIVTLRIYKQELNDILCIIWDEFWPADMVTKEIKKKIKQNVYFVKFFSIMYLCTAFTSCSLFMAYPLVTHNGNLPLASIYPFSYTSLPTYELLYVWHWFNNFIVVLVLSGHDFFLSTLITNVVAQFQILQEVLLNVFTSEDTDVKGKLLEIINKDKRVFSKYTSDRDIFFKCIEHHKLLMAVCTKMENVFSFIIFIQFFVSTVALCVSSFVLTVNPSESMNMLSYAMAHMMQLFIYCSMGNELIYQSQFIADAAYLSGWHLSHDKHVRSALIMLIQRSQKQCQLTALGFVELSYRSLLVVLRLSFSFFTMLNNLKNK